MRRLFWAFALLALVSSDAALAQTKKTPPYYASISAGRARMRTGPGKTYPASWLYVRADLPVRVTAVFKEWRKVEDPDGTEGWMLANLLSETRTGYVRRQIAELRERPSPGARVVWRAEPGVVGRLSQCGGGWCRLDVKGQAGYVEAVRLWGVDPAGVPAVTIAGFDLNAFVTTVLAEDLGEVGDITSAAVIPEDERFAGVMDTRDAIVVAGLEIAEAFFRRLDPEVRIERLVGDGERAAAGTDLMRLSGRARAMLTAERSALNTVQHLSGIATLTRRYVDAIAGTGAILLDTRKTLPGLRVLEKYATRMGGAQNHRMGLWDAAMIKDNHVAVAGGVGPAVRRAVEAGIERIIVEVDRLDQIAPALDAGATHLLLDNMPPPVLRQAVALVGGRVPTEASGGVTLETIRAVAETGVTYISVGRLTQSAPAADIGLDFTGEAA